MRWLVACAALLPGIAGAAAAGMLASPAAAVTNLYAPQRLGDTSPGTLSQFAVAADGTLSALAAAPLGTAPQDIAITPNAQHAYVTVAVSGPGTIAQFNRGAGGRMEPAGSVPAGNFVQGIVVNPQGTHVYYADQFDATLSWRPIGAGGALGAVTSVPLASSPRFIAMTPSGTSLYVGVDRDGPADIFQFNVDPATGAATPKSPATVGWPTPPANVPTPTIVRRMSVTPDGAHLYAASGDAATGIAHYAIDASGSLVGGSVLAAPGDRNGTSVVPVSPSGAFLWAPTSFFGTTTGRIEQYAIGAGGALSALAPASVAYSVNSPTRDAVAHPDGRTLYLGQDANIGLWAIAAGGTLTARANSTVPGNLNAGIVVSPSQAPVASFVATPQPAGQATTFDAAASSDPDGTVARYDWDFGDGATLPNGGAAPSHVYSTAGARNVTLTVTDADGTSTSQLWTGTQVLRNGGPSAQTTRGVNIPAVAGQGPPGPRPTPDKGKSVVLEVVSGTVKVKLPGSKVYVDVKTLREIPLGSRIDTRKGRVRLTAEVNAKTHKTQSSVFYDGIFVVTQTKGSKPILDAKLAGGTFAGCAPRRTSSRAAGAQAGLVQSAATKKRSKRKVRRLWGRGVGQFRTTGRRSSATVRGTWWLVEDRCDGTLTRVRFGKVDVRDLRLKKTIKLRSGKRSTYLAKAP